MSQPPQYPPNPDEPRRDHPQGQYPSSGQPQQGRPYSPPPSFGQQGGYGSQPGGFGPEQGGYGQQQGGAYGGPPSGGFAGYSGGQGGSLYDNPYIATAGGYPGPTRSERHSGEPSGARMWRRPTARATTSFAGAGAVLLVLGIAVWTGGYFADGVDVAFSSTGGPSASGDGRRFLGAAMFAIAAVVGYLIAAKLKRGPLATAGAVLAALGVPLFLLFITLSIEDVYRNGDYPFNVDVVYVLSIVAWLATYFFVPGLRGRAVFLGAAALGFSNYVALKSAGTDSLRSAVQAGPGGALGGATGTGVAVAGIVIGLVYYLLAFWLDRHGRVGSATPLALAGFVTTIGGVFAGIPDFEIGGTGVALVLLGAVLTVYGGWAGRRFTAWIWATATITGLVLLVSNVLDTDTDSYTAFGVTFIVLGAALAAIAAVAHSIANERAELD